VQDRFLRTFPIFLDEFIALSANQELLIPVPLFCRLKPISRQRVHKLALDGRLLIFRPNGVPCISLFQAKTVWGPLLGWTPDRQEGSQLSCKTEGAKKQESDA
jgi:hypothetical protein